jgi:hypothetical protein
VRVRAPPVGRAHDARVCGAPCLSCGAACIAISGDPGIGTTRLAQEAIALAAGDAAARTLHDGTSADRLTEPRAGASRRPRGPLVDWPPSGDRGQTALVRSSPVTAPEIHDARPVSLVRDIDATLSYYRDQLGFNTVASGDPPNFASAGRGSATVLYDAPHGFREFGTQDPDGYDIAFGQPLG